MNYFTFKGINSKNIKGLIVQELPQIVKPKKRFAKTEIEGLDGDILEQLGYEAYDKPIKIGITKECDIDRLIYWLDGSGQLILSNEPTKYYNAEIVDSIDFERLLRYKIATIKFHVQPYKYLINEEKKIIEPEETEENEEITIENSCKANMKLKISGNSWQATRSGKNLSPVNSATITGTTSNTKTIGGIANSVLVKDVPIENGAEYIISMIKPNEVENPQVFLYNEPLKVNTHNGAWAEIIPNNRGTQLLINDIIKNTSNYEYMAVTVGNDSTYEANTAVTIPIEELMIRKSDTTSEYEPYGAMPSPEFPSRVRNCGDNVNLFYLQNENVPNQAWFSIDENQLLKIKQGTGITPTPIPIDIDLNVGDTVTISAYCVSGKYTTGEISVGLYHSGSDKTWEGYVTLPKGISLKNKTYTTTITVNNTVDTFMPFVYGNPSIEEDIKFYFKVKKGSIATLYTPHNCGSADIKVQNKNLLELTKCSFVGCVLNENGSIKSNIKNDYFCSINTTELNELLMQNRGKDFTFSIGTDLGSGKYVSIVIYGTRQNGSTYQEEVKISSDVTINISEDFTNITNLELRFNRLYTEFTDTTTTIPYVQFEFGETATSHVLHQEQIKSFPFTEGQVLHKRDYLASDGIHHMRKTKIFDGTEFWSKDPNVNLDVDYFYTKAVPITTSNINNVYVSHFIKGNAEKEGFWATTVFCITISKEFTGIVAEDTSEKRTSKFKAWLAEQYANGTPVTVEYELAEEEIEPYTEEQQVAYNKIKELYSYEDVTHISSDDEIKPKIVTSYFSKDDIVLKNEGYMESKPIINVYGTGDIEISLNNNKVFSIDMQNDEFITIDAMKEDAYKGIILKNRQMNGEFDNIKLQPGENIISWTGDLSKIEVEPKSRWL